MPVIDEEITTKEKVTLRFTWPQVIAALAAAEGFTAPDMEEDEDAVQVLLVELDPNAPPETPVAEKEIVDYDLNLSEGIELRMTDVEPVST